MRFLLSFVAVTCALAQQGGGGNLPEPLRAAQGLARQGKIDEAAQLYRTFLDANPTSVPALTGMANLLDVMGQSPVARGLFQRALEAVETPAARAQVKRSMAMSYAFDNDCENAAKLLEEVYQYWVGMGDAYQQGEMLNEAARVCIEAGQFDTAETLYRRGTEAGLKQKDIPPDRVALWQFRLEHALGRLAARRGSAADAARHVAAARKLLDGNKEMAQQQEIFFPYLAGYVALYLGEPAKAVTALEKANQNDVFIQLLLGMAHEKLGNTDKAEGYFAKAGATTGHNPPAAFARYYTRTRK